MAQLPQSDKNARNVMATSESRVLVIMTGGTICMQRSQSGYVPATRFQEACLAGIPLFDDGFPPTKVDVVINTNGDIKTHFTLRTPPSAYQRKTRYTVFEFDELVDSCSVGGKEWTDIAKIIFFNYNLFDGFVVLHGTDTLAYTASALSFMLQNLRKPVILTGAQAPMRELQSDAIHNLLGSLVIAGHFVIPEVCIYFNNRLLRGNRATKTSASDFAAFDSPNYPPLAITSSSRTNVAWELIRKPNEETFSLPKVLHTKAVASLRLFPGIRTEMVDAVLKMKGLRGLVLETFGPGSAPLGPDQDLVKMFARAADEGILIISVSQCLTGSVNPIYDSIATLSKAGIVAGFDMTTEAALTKLAYLFALPNSTRESVAESLVTPLRGELTESSTPVFKHPKVGVPKNVPAFSDLCHAISLNDVERVQVILNCEDRSFLNDSDYMGNTPLHVAAISPSIAILRLILLNGASPRIQNRTDNTPLFLAATAGLELHVLLLLESGARLCPDERKVAKLLLPNQPQLWKIVEGMPEIN